METGLYVHVPFCARKCPYCDFYSETNGVTVQRAFLDALDREMSTLPGDFHPSTIFIGGGTPTELPPPLLERLLQSIQTHLPVAAVREWTCEANPGTLSSAHAQLLHTYGVNRMSVGAQTFNADALQLLGRIHRPDDITNTVQCLQAAGFRNINLDLMFALPGQPDEQIVHDIEQAAALHITHIACYALIFEAHTPFSRQLHEGTLREITDDRQASQYNLLRAALQTEGFTQYELSNFGRAAHRCRHNQLYWTGGDYYGVGPAAHSHWKGRRFANVRDVHRYIQDCQSGRSPVSFEEQLPPEAKARETLVMWLRLCAGVPRHEFQAVTGFDYDTLCGPEIEQATHDGLLTREEDRIRLTKKAYFISDQLFSALI